MKRYINAGALLLAGTVLAATTAEAAEDVWGQTEVADTAGLYCKATQEWLRDANGSVNGWRTTARLYASDGTRTSTPTYKVRARHFDNARFNFVADSEELGSWSYDREGGEVSTALTGPNDWPNWYYAGDPECMISRE